MASGEDRILRLIGSHFANSHPSAPFGRGDDCVLLKPDYVNGDSALIALTTDIFAENSHFRRRYFSPYEIGRKALAVNISDLAAEGARPSGFSLALTLRGDESEEWLDDFFNGMAEMSAQYDMLLSGGDLSKGDSLHVAVTAWGDYAHGGRPLLRRGAYDPASGDMVRDVMKEGDVIFLIGEVGLAAAGLKGLEEAEDENGSVLFKKRYPSCAAAHLSPTPLTPFGTALSLFSADSYSLSEEAYVSLMDVSDGLARDLPRILGREGLLTSKTPLGADISLTPDSEELLAFCSEYGLDADAFAFSGGEDYALLGICPAQLWPEIQELMGKTAELSSLAVPVRKLGTVTGGGIRLNGKEVQFEGFDHFSLQHTGV
ncbi:MAG: thiamine-monophosphate kinase [Mailhella sp.]|nr:thiamine-monophosphate kinase [Mailhella sp.]